MIHYHGTPVGGSRSSVAEFLVGRHALVPFARPDDIAIVAEACQSFVFDNSAFSFWQKGAGKVDYRGYLEWVYEWHRHPGFSWALIPDVIDGSTEDNDDLIERWQADAPWASGVPVYHMHEPTERLRSLALSHDFPAVALGSSGSWATPGTKQWWVRMSEIMRAVCDDQGRPLCKLHGLRMLAPQILERLPLASADSTNAARHGGSISRFGMYPAPTTGQRAIVVASRIEAQNTPAIWQEDFQEELAL